LLCCSCTITAINTAINTAVAAALLLLLLCCAAALVLLLCYCCCFTAAALLLLRPPPTIIHQVYEFTTFYRSEALLSNTRMIIQVILSAERKIWEQNGS